MTRLLLCISISLVAACSADSNSNTELPIAPETVLISTNFNDGAQNWAAGFSDYPVADAEIYELETGLTSLPGGSSEQGFRTKSINRSDDIFMYLKHQVTSLEANQRYVLHGSFTFWSNAGVGCTGIGGAPGESVFVKIGASELEPEQVDYFLNLDKGNQSQPGSDAIVVGNVAAEDADCFGSSFGEKTIEVIIDEGFEVQSSVDGHLWIFIGTDSGYEGLTDLYYQNIELSLTPLD